LTNNWCGGADIDRNGSVNEVDLRIFVLDWLQDNISIQGDLNGDCKIDMLDVAIMAKIWTGTQENWKTLGRLAENWL
jgi:hypothetical protein